MTLASVGLCAGAAADPALRCFEPKDLTSRLLQRRLGGIHVDNAGVRQVVDSLRQEHHVPISFLEAEAPATVSLELPPGTVEQALSALVAQAAGYQFGFVKDHLTLYAKDERYGSKTSASPIAGVSRIKAASQLGMQLRDLEPFSHLALPIVMGVGLGGRSYLYADPVTITGETVLEQVVSLAGSSPSVVVSMAREGFWGLMLSIGSVEQLQSLKLSVPKLILTPGDAVAISVAGIDRDGMVRDLSGNECGTRYAVQAPGVLSVNADGLVTAKTGGHAAVSAAFEGLSESLWIEVAGRSGPKKQ